MEQFKCRASGAGALMTNPRNKTELLSETTKTYLQDWLKEKIYGTRKDINNKYLEKGILMEDEAIDKAIEWLDLPFAMKNKDRFEDEFFTGEPDLIVGDTVYDIKNSWDCFSFPLFENEIPTNGYFYQLQVYMHLTGLKKAKLVYVLLNTPATYNNGEVIYDNVDKKYRIKTFDIEYSEEVINQLKERVQNAREYINQIKL